MASPASLIGLFVILSFWGRLFVARLASTVDKSTLNHTLIHVVNNLTQTFDTKL